MAKENKKESLKDVIEDKNVELKIKAEKVSEEHLVLEDDTEHPFERNEEDDIVAHNVAMYGETPTPNSPAKGSIMAELPSILNNDSSFFFLPPFLEPIVLPKPPPFKPPPVPPEPRDPALAPPPPPPP